MAGSLDALIELLMPTESHYPEKTYSYAFILCSRLFIRPYELLSKVSRVSPSPYFSLSSLSLSSSSFMPIFLRVDISHEVETADDFRAVSD